MRIDPLSPEEVVSWLAAKSTSKRLLLNHNLHSVYLFTKSRHFRRAYGLADKVIVDGFPVLAVLNLERKMEGGEPFSRNARCGSTDWIHRLEGLREGTRIGLIGASRDSNEAAVAELERMYPSFEIRGWNGFEQATQLAQTSFAELKEFSPELVLIGLGMPKQELYVLEHWDNLPTATYASVGGAIDQISGHQKLAPRWTGKYGIEWLWRLLSDPRRLYARYLVEPFKLIPSTVQYRRQMNDEVKVA
ncbi:WecB/TagA/CpsF family glycosyltransferase [Rhodococcus pyridinivorans]|uniref:WecB/TagA/CpsF family glycosyltransferase n=1 Tax=Rhodococcus pyridinivorans TaxID=103816 RepID=UPI0020C70D59|nr:WecB/TagA/CpsF family glycosyltransferase [Rhodococcus pyridinivorans]UTM36545.1 WecB/TagA/CpsF family glycosyltransferase [Rhodococcus pyridinivorans]